MPSLSGTVYGIVAAAIVNGPASTFRANRGFTSVTRRIDGATFDVVYTLTLDQAVNIESEAIVSLATHKIAGVVAVPCCVERVSDTVIEVWVTSGFDASFWIRIERIVP